MIRIYHNPQCKKSRAGLAYLQAINIDFEVVEYIKKPLDAAQLKQLIAKTGLRPKDFVRTQEVMFKQLYKDQTFTDAQWLHVLATNPRLLKRPIFESHDSAVWADPPEKSETIFNLKNNER